MWSLRIVEDKVFGKPYSEKRAGTLESSNP